MRHFSCGRAELDDWLRSAGLNADASGTGRTHVWVDDAGTVVAYHVLAPHLVLRGDVSRKIGRGSPDIIPAILLARLAFAEDHQGKGFGEALLFDALERALHGIEIVGGRLIVVDAIDERAARFYERYEFVRTPRDRGRLVIKASDAARSLGIEWS